MTRPISKPKCWRQDKTALTPGPCLFRPQNDEVDSLMSGSTAIAVMVVTSGAQRHLLIASAGDWSPPAAPGPPCSHFTGENAQSPRPPPPYCSSYRAPTVASRRGEVRKSECPPRLCKVTASATAAGSSWGRRGGAGSSFAPSCRSTQSPDRPDEQQRIEALGGARAPPHPTSPPPSSY